jgi:hypothetical protein
MKPTLKPKDSKMMKVKLRVNCAKFGVFFIGNSNAMFFNRSGHKEQCVISSFPKGHPLECVQFLKGLKTERYNTASRIRNHCAAILQVPEVDLMDAEVRKTKFRGRIGWVNSGGGGGSYSTVDVEILHKDYGGEYSLSSIFLNPILMGVSIYFAIEIPITHCLFE